PPLARGGRHSLPTPRPPDDAPLMRELAVIGVRPGGTVEGQPAAVLDEAVRQANRRIADWLDPDARHVNGWEIPIHPGSFGTDYLRRASVAMRSPGLAPTRDVLYATLRSAPATDDQGRPLRYRIRFARDQWPPVSAFASITAYDSQGFLIPNPYEIYSVGHIPPPVAAPDGSIEIALQYEDPRPRVPDGHWLPITPTGDFSLTLRLYAPKEAAIDGTWQPPPMTPAD
ncbi:DUF1214 domain-containing protein, partial [Nocardia sp. NPDC058497]|uniref:DUF1214 domain-containing protein n=1 Tax=Nocardia sp. NPDC058497 TaxID=3346529 RepID=UPI00364AACBB